MNEFRLRVCRLRIVVQASTVIISFFDSLLRFVNKDNGPRGVGQFCGGIWVSFQMESTAQRPARPGNTEAWLTPYRSRWNRKWAKRLAEIDTLVSWGPNSADMSSGSNLGCLDHARWTVNQATGAVIRPVTCFGANTLWRSPSSVCCHWTGVGTTSNAPACGYQVAPALCRCRKSHAAGWPQQTAGNFRPGPGCG